MDEANLWLNLLRVPRLGPMGVAKFFRAGFIEQLFSQDPQTLAQLPLNQAQCQALLRPDQDFLAKVKQWQELRGGSVIPLVSPLYPELLRHIADPPLVLFVLGDPVKLDMPQLAMVGSRHASPTGRMIARNLAQQVANSGYGVTSGLALGIDACAHEGALESGVTLAVLGSGLEKIYPKRHQGLADQILTSGGLLISELPPWVMPQAFHFPRRNRIISGLSEGVLVVEASMKSGSLITARLAAEQGREVFAVPGALGNPESRGCHQLIKDGAALVETIEDIFLLKDLNFTPPPPHSCTDSAEQLLPNSLLLDNVRDNATSVDDLVQHTGLAVEVVLSELLELEVQGRVASVPGGFIRLRGS